MLSVLLFSVLLCYLPSFGHGNSLSNGWNDGIEWKKLDDALKESKETNKPVMLLIHKSWCGACKALKPKFAESTEIEALARNFVMVNTLDDDEPQDAKYKPDGGYIPRIFFIDHGEVVEDLYNTRGNPKYKYYYHNAESIKSTMEQALTKFPASGHKEL